MSIHQAMMTQNMSPILDSQTITSATITTPASPGFGEAFTITTGFGGGGGSISDGTSNIYGGASITRFYWEEEGLAGIPPYNYNIYLTIAGDRVSTRTNWNKVYLESTESAALFQGDASCSANATHTTWTWAVSTPSITSGVYKFK